MVLTGFAAIASARARRGSARQPRRCWNSARPHVGLWLLLIALPLVVLVTGCAVLLWNDDARRATHQMLAAIPQGGAEPPRVMLLRIEARGAPSSNLKRRPATTMPNRFQSASRSTPSERRP